MLIDEQTLSSWGVCDRAFELLRRASPDGKPIDSRPLIVWLLQQDGTMPKIYAQKLAIITRDREYRILVESDPAYIEADQTLIHYKRKFAMQLL